MIQNNEVTILVHGPISLYTILSLYRYRAEYPMIFVIPKPKIHKKEEVKLLEELQGIVSKLEYNTTIITYDPYVQQRFDNEQNRYLHFFSVTMGLQICNTPYVIKLRSDEFYSTLTPMIEAMENSENKIITNDVFFRKRKDRPIHPSDHLMGGQTSVFKKVFTVAREYCENKERFNTNPLVQIALSGPHKTMSAEQVLGIAILSSMAEGGVSDDVTLMGKFFEIIPSDKFGFFRIASNSQNTKQYFDSSYFDNGTDINNIKDYNYE